jgi:thiamine biosynthesis protein ThiS
MKTIAVSVRVFPGRKKQLIKLPARSKVAGLLKALELNPQTIVVRCNGKIVAEEERLKSEDQVEIIHIVTGG